MAYDHYVRSLDRRDEIEELVRKVIDEYHSQMTEIVCSSEIPPSSLELRAAHARLMMSAIDSYRKNSSGIPIGVWRVERELRELFNCIASNASQVRRRSFGELALATRTTQQSTVETN